MYIINDNYSDGNEITLTISVLYMVSATADAFNRLLLCSFSVRESQGGRERGGGWGKEGQDEGENVFEICETYCTISARHLCTQINLGCSVVLPSELTSSLVLSGLQSFPIYIGQLQLET